MNAIHARRYMLPRIDKLDGMTCCILDSVVEAMERRPGLHLL